MDLTMTQIDPSTSFQGLKAFLLLHGTSLAGIARRHRESPGLMQQVARRYWGTDRRPHGIVTNRLLTLLRCHVLEMKNGAMEGCSEQAAVASPVSETDPEACHGD